MLGPCVGGLVRSGGDGDTVVPTRTGKKVGVSTAMAVSNAVLVAQNANPEAREQTLSLSTPPERV